MPGATMCPVKQSTFLMLPATLPLTLPLLRRAEAPDRDFAPFPATTRGGAQDTLPRYGQHAGRVGKT